MRVPIVEEYLAALDALAAEMAKNGIVPDTVYLQWRKDQEARQTEPGLTDA